MSTETTHNEHIIETKPSVVHEEHEQKNASVKPKQKKLWMIIGILIVVVLISGYFLSQHSAKPVMQNTVIKIGLIAPLTGDVANYGQVMRNGAEMAKRDLSLEGVTFQLIQRDTGCDGKKAAAATDELAKQGVIAIIGEICSGATLAALPEANSNKILLLSPSSSSPALSIADDFFFRTYPTDTYQGVVVSKLMQKAGIKKIAILYGNDAYGKGLDEFVISNFKKIGGTVLSNTIVEDTATNFVAKLKAIQALKPDALYIVGDGEAASAAIVVEARQMGLNVPVYGSDSLKDVNFITDVGSAGNGMTIVAPTTGNRAFLDEYKATYGSEPANATGPQSYDAFMAIAQAVKDGARTGEDLRQAFPKINFEGKSGHIQFDKYGDLDGGAYIIFTIQNGKFVVVNQ